MNAPNRNRPEKQAFREAGEKSVKVEAERRAPRARPAGPEGKSVRPEKQFPIVGLGASAGGLEAFTQLLRELPVNTGMAFVLVQHLDPDHESALTQLLAKITALPVTEVTHGTAVKPNHVYVIPPNACMEISGGVLKLRPRDKAPGAHRSIDVFLESLAQDQQERAIGVILSGTATDGTQGLEAIKSEGGITFAQDASAKYDSMPLSAVASGCVDLVLSPREIAKELERIAKHPFIARSRPSSLHPDGGIKPAGPDDLAMPLAVGEKSFIRILRLLHNRHGVDFSLYRPNTIQRRITRRMVLNRRNSLDDYTGFLKGNPRELDLLYSDVLIGVTSFFRNPEAFEALAREVFPVLLDKRRPEDPVRVWTLGCSTGQEAYSIAMAFTEYCEHVPRSPKLQVFATDLNDSLLEKARHGLYTKGQVADISPERLQRFFVEEQGGYRVRKSLRELCVFARQNILSDPPFSRMDLISCRNLLIYIEPGLQKSIVPNFHYALKPGGFLFLGASESIGGFANLFEPADKKQKIFRKRMGLIPCYSPPISQDRPVELKENLSGKRAPAADGFLAGIQAQHEADRMVASQFAPPSVLINADFDVLQFRGATKAFLEPPKGKASFNVLKMARADLMLPLRAAINKAKKENIRVSTSHVRLDEADRKRLVHIEVLPLKNLKERTYLILFEEKPQGRRAGPQPAFEQPVKIRSGLREPKSEPGKEWARIADLERELAEARDYAQSLQEQHEASNEELQASSEELQSANEELQSLNEELETSKEELESTNEELITVNEEMASRNVELNRLNSDMANLQTSTNLPIVLLGPDLSIRRFSPRAQKQFNLTATDVGQPSAKLQLGLSLPDLDTFVGDVIAGGRESDCEVQDKQGRWHFLRARPYIAPDNKVDGAVLVLMDITALKESQQAVIAARDLAESILRTSRDPFLILNAELRVELANEAFYRTFKASPEDSVGRTVFELDEGHWNVPTLRDLLLDILPRHSFFDNFEVTAEFEHIGRRTMLLNARTLSETSGQPARILLGIQDMTELLRVQDRMQESELRYRRLFEAARDGVLVIDPNSRKIIDANPYMTELLGYSHEELVGKELFEIGLLKDEEASRAAFEELHKNKFIRYEDLPLETKDGLRREVEFVSNLYREGEGNVIQCNVRDVTERKRAERQLAEKARLLDLSNDAIIVRGLDDKISLWNKGAQRLYGWTSEEAIGKPLHALLVAEFPKPTEEIVDDLYRDGQFSGEVVQIARDGRRVHSLCRWVLDKDTESILTSYTDITERNKMELELRHAHAQLADRAGHLESAVAERTSELTAANKQMEAFIYSIAHDLRAPFRAMQGFSTMLLEEAGPTLNETGQNYAKRISKSAQYMDTLLQDLLAFSRISQQRVELVSVNLEAVIESTLAHLQPDIRDKGAGIENLGPWPCVRAHEPTLAQVCFNLMSNALKFTAPGVPPFIRLRTQEIAGFVRVWIEDNGIGIAPDHQEQVFRLFTRLNGEKYPGTGTGLALVEKGAERMGGRAGVESHSGQGSRFWFELRKA